jgi:hypothetical protein
MQLDRTAIVISQRNADELMDLSLVVIRNYWHSILLFAFLGAMPFALLNAWLLGPIADYDSLVMSSPYYSDPDLFFVRYLMVMSGMVFLQSPMAMSMLTYFLGQAVFIEKPTIQQVLGVVRSRWLATVWILGILRCGLVSLGIGLWYHWNRYFQPEIEVTFFGLLVLVMIYLVRGFRPFAPEILLLERCPIVRARNANVSKATELPYGKRSSWIHSGTGDLFSVHVGLTIVGVIFVLVVSYAFLFSVGVLVGVWRWGFWMDRVFFPIALWAMATWGTVIRFLLYMNTRIRSEGWEVELMLKAEAQRLKEAM